jgi:hypothetical protein
MFSSEIVVSGFLSEAKKGRCRNEFCKGFFWQRRSFSQVFSWTDYVDGNSEED